MKALSPEVQVFRDYLDGRALKFTEQRRVILDTFLDHEGHRSVEDILQTARTVDAGVSYTTVYRTMKLLAEAGLAREIDLADGITRYEHLYNHQHHDHLICTSCGLSIEFLSPELEAFQDRASRKLGFRVLDHKLQIFGLCENCAA